MAKGNYNRAPFPMSKDQIKQAGQGDDTPNSSKVARPTKHKATGKPPMDIVKGG